MLRKIRTVVFAFSFLNVYWGGYVLAQKAEVTGRVSPSSQMPAASDAVVDAEAGLVHVEQSIFRIHASMLGADHEFLLFGNMAMPKRADFSSNQGRVIWFEQSEDELVVYQSSVGKVVDPTQNHRLLLAKLPAEEDDDWIEFDLLPLLEKYNQQDWYHAPDIREDESVDVYHSNLDQIIPLEECVVQNVIPSRQEKNAFALQLTATVPHSNDPWQTLFEEMYSIPEVSSSMSVSVSYYLMPRRANDAFQPRRGSHFRKVGYFEARPQVEVKTGNVFRHILKWDFSNAAAKPVTFYLSRNTPEKYQEALLAAIRFVSKHFANDPLRGAIAPEGIHAPHPDYNIIQWTEYERSGLAYADVMADPLTGQIHHAQVNLYSGWMEHTKQDLYNKYGRDLAKLDGDKIDRLVSYVLSCVLAHELLHVMGLRHNFAGHKGNVLTPAMFDDFVEKILADPTQKLEIPSISSSVMDYLNMDGDIIFGHQIVVQQIQPAVYDRMAIAWGYDEQPWSEWTEKSAPLFSTDDHDARDGVVRGTFANPFVNSQYVMSKRLSQVPLDLLTTFIHAKSSKDLGERRPVGMVVLDAERDAGFVLNPQHKALSYLAGGVRLRELEHLNNVALVQDSEAYYTFYYAWLEQQLAEAGGLRAVTLGALEQALVQEQGLDLEPQAKKRKVSKSASPALVKAFSSGWLQSLKQEYLTLVDEAAQRTFMGYNDQPVSFSAEELAVMRQAADGYFERFGQEFVYRTLRYLNKVKWKTDLPSPVSDFWERGFEELVSLGHELAEQVIRTRHEEKSQRGVIRLSKYRAMHVDLPEFRFCHKARLEASLWIENILHLLGGSYVPAVKLHQWFDEYFAELMGSKESMRTFVCEGDLSLTFKNWIRRQLEIRQALPSKAPSSSEKK